MTYAELVAEIKLLSKRGDIDDKIAIALRMTTLRAHRSDFFWRDLVEATMDWPDLETAVNIDTSTELTRFRQVNYLRYYDPDTEAYGTMLESVDPRELLDEYNYEKLDRYYMAGSTLRMKFLAATKGAAIGYYQNPDVAAITYNSWIKDQLPDLLVQGSLAYLYNLTGQQEEARVLNIMVGFEPDPQRRAGGGQSLLEQLKASQLLEQAH